MVSLEEKNKLLKEYDFEAVSAAWTTFKCAVCLLTIVGIAFIGSDTGRGGHNADGRLYAPLHEGAALAHVKAITAERRARFESRRRAGAETVGSTTSGPVTAAGASSAASAAAIHRRATE